MDLTKQKDRNIIKKDIKEIIESHQWLEDNHLYIRFGTSQKLCIGICFNILVMKQIIEEFENYFLQQQDIKMDMFEITQRKSYSYGSGLIYSYITLHLREK